MPYQLGILMVRHRWWVVGVWIVVFLLSLLVAPSAFSSLTGGFGRADTESRRALDLLESELGAERSTISLIFHHPDLTISDPKYERSVKEALSPVLERPDVVEVITPYDTPGKGFVSDDGHTSHTRIVLEGTIDEALDDYPEIRRKVSTPPGFDVWGTGGIAIISNLNRAAGDDLRRSETVTFPLVLIALTLVFGTLVAVGLPIAMAGISVSMTLAMVYLLAQVTDVSIFVLNIASFLGIGVAIDYTLLVINRFREELSVRSKEEAVGVTLATAGRSILFSGLTSVLGLSGLLLFPFMALRSMGIGGVSVILLSMMISMTLVPALLGILGHRVNAFSVTRILPAPKGVWRRLAWGVMKHPVLVALPLMAGLLLLGAPFLGANIGAPWASVLPSDDEARVGWEVAERELGPGELAPIVIVAEAPESIFSPSAIANLYDYTRSLEMKPGVRRVESIVSVDSDPALTMEQYQALYATPSRQLSPEHNRLLDELATDDITVINVFTDFPTLSEEDKAFLSELRSDPIGGGFKKMVTGVTADLVDANDTIYRYFPFVILYVLLTNYLVLMVLFRSVLLPLKAVLMNSMSIFASYGALVFIFQQGHLSGLLGFTSQGSLETTVPITLFCILFGLSMDYEVFLLSRVKEIYDETGNNTESVVLGLEKTGRIITSAALIIIIVAGAFATSEIIVVKAFGVGIVIAVFLDATVVRALLVPALMRIMGDWNWWAPAVIRRVLPKQRFVA
ncbi:MAG: hypothetical protein BZY82_11225 [SAR202 cluster bacterium Io17-Chloro-G3]|nr:MAG: hypothetical protein BZY82_11225 [SAR202 cluster bacterium Io17-Chloro-G3]